MWGAGFRRIVIDWCKERGTCAATDSQQEGWASEQEVGWLSNWVSEISKGGIAILITLWDGHCNYALHDSSRVWAVGGEVR